MQDVCGLFQRCTPAQTNPFHRCNSAQTNPTHLTPTLTLTFGGGFEVKWGSHASRGSGACFGRVFPPSRADERPASTHTSSILHVAWCRPVLHMGQLLFFRSSYVLGCVSLVLSYPVRAHFDLSSRIFFGFVCLTV